MNCSQCRELLEEYCMDELSAEAMREMEAHIEGCPGCESAQMNVVESIEQLALAIEPLLPPPEVKDRLNQTLRRQSSGDDLDRRALDFPQSGNSSSPSGEALGGQKIVAKIAAYAIAASLAFGIGLWLGSSQSRNQSADSRSLTPHRLDEAQSSFPSSRIRQAHVVSSTAPKGVEGHLLWDTLAQQLHVTFFGLPASQPGDEFVLWMMQENQPPTLLGTLTPNAAGTATDVFDVASPDSRPLHVQLTKEPATATPEPSGPTFLDVEIQ